MGQYIENPQKNPHQAGHSHGGEIENPQKKSLSLRNSHQEGHSQKRRVQGLSSVRARYGLHNLPCSPVILVIKVIIVTMVIVVIIIIMTRRALHDLLLS